MHHVVILVLLIVFFVGGIAFWKHRATLKRDAENARLQFKSAAQGAYQEASADVRKEFRGSD